uniref:Uncharacterized protein n=1 Tax=Zea mays TaxID=4577 RepID=B4FW01_MAIZE|nr:unknown [Zea mays]
MLAAARPLPAPWRRGEARRRISVTRPTCGGLTCTRGAPMPWTRSWRPAPPSATTPSRPAPCQRRW